MSSTPPQSGCCWKFFRRGRCGNEVHAYRRGSRLSPTSEPSLQPRPRVHRAIHLKTKHLVPEELLVDAKGVCLAYALGWTHGFGRRPWQRRVSHVRAYSACAQYCTT